jgi:hypothetical protein
VPVLRSEWNEPLRAQRDPLAEDAWPGRANRDEHRHLPRQSWLGRFVHLRMACLRAAGPGRRDRAGPLSTVTGTRAETTTDPVDTVQAPPTIGSQGTEIIGAPPRGSPSSTSTCPPESSRGRSLRRSRQQGVAHRPGTDPQVGQGTAKVFHYTVEIEDGVDTAATAATVSPGWSPRR